VIAHLLESTLILGITIAVAHLPRLAARTRYAVVFLALLKFAVPWKFHPPGGTIEISVPGPITAVAPHAFASAAPLWPTIVEAVWLSVAVMLFVLIIIRARRAAADALDGAVAAEDFRGVAVLRSPNMAAPAAIGILRPRIVIPADLDLGRDELEAILVHERAHIARRDNLLALLDAALGCALWFHPLVWIARRILARAREEACDEIVVARSGADTYLAALAKVCRAAAAPRVAGISCIVSNTLRERMEAIMTLSLRRALPHRIVVAAAVALLAAVTLVHAKEGASRYTMQVGINIDHEQFVFDVAVRDHTTNEIVAKAKLTAPPGVPAEATIDGTPKYVIRAVGQKDGHAEVTMKVLDENGNPVDGVKSDFTVNRESAAQPITLNLKDADLKDVVRVFGQLTNLETKVDSGVDGRVSVHFEDVPWDQALQRILFENKCEYQIEGKTIHVRRIR
jgi:beta-lactamase regulating signal transducer with metallopeptidase domain